ncbi:hypothetical protein KKF91_11865 [Myxococcota bacterium]|nr:hypothetical protein [Myxococcota bacterium]MBU1431226.1 hypothetical protein [Myxococcota bacterium]MBU1896327.1 hypothetical protein [Myxococcota bacterium]
MKQLDLLPPPPPLTRAEAIERLEGLIGEDLRALADVYGIPVGEGRALNKGWAGQTVECALGRRPNSEAGADFGDWELKVVPLALTAGGRLRVKETMAIARFTAEGLEGACFEESHLLEKLRRLLIVARIDDVVGTYLISLAAFDLTAPDLWVDIREDYEEIRAVMRDQGEAGLTGRLGRWVQPRPKGAEAGGGWGFYARKPLVARALALDALNAALG